MRGRRRIQSDLHRGRERRDTYLTGRGLSRNHRVPRGMKRRGRDLVLIQVYLPRSVHNFAKWQVYIFNVALRQCILMFSIYVRKDVTICA